MPGLCGEEPVSSGDAVRAVLALLVIYLILGVVNQGKGHHYNYKLALFVDLFFCAAIWRDADITISSMCGLELRSRVPVWWAKVLGGLLNRIQANHCELAIKDDMLRCGLAMSILEGREHP